MDSQRDQLPIETNGIYIRKINPFIEFKDYKFSRLEQIWDIIMGKKIGNYYSVIVFNYDKTMANYYMMYGEVFDITNRVSKFQKEYDFVVNCVIESCIEIITLTKGDLIFQCFKNQYTRDSINFSSNDHKEYHNGGYVFIPFSIYKNYHD
jgi:RNAse (barnase) inhibitor barstar